MGLLHTFFILVAMYMLLFSSCSAYYIDGVMSSSESAFSLLEMLRAKYGVDDSDLTLGPSVVVPNQALKRKWALCLQQAGIHMYASEQAGKLAWFIPLKGMLTYLGHAEDPPGNKTPQPTSTLRGTQGEAPGRGCIVSRP
jgi:hypothetical protein